MNVYIPLINLSNHGGVRIIVEFANYLASHGNNVNIIVPNDDYNSVYKLSEKNIKIKKIGKKINNKILKYFIFLVIYPFYIKSNSVVIANFFPTYFPAILWSLMKKGKVIYFIQDIESKYKGVIGKIINSMCDLTYKQIFNDVKVTANKHLQRILLEKYRTNVKSINIGLSSSFEEEKISQNKDKKYDILFFLRREKWKRSHLLPVILQKLKNDYGLAPTVVGVSQDLPLLDEYSEYLTSSVTPNNDSELIDIIDSAKVLLFTSEKEGFGLPPLECMSRGVPGVVYECGGPSIYIKNGVNSFIVNDDDDAVKSIALLLNDDDFYNTLSQRSRDTAMGYSNTQGFFEFLDIVSMEDVNKNHKI